MVQIKTALASLFAVLSVVSASTIVARQASTTTPVDENGDTPIGIAVSTSFQICANNGLTGGCFTWTTQPLNGVCYSLAANRPEFDNRVSSVLIEESFAVCELFDNANCAGASVQMFGGAVANLASHGFDNRMSTWRCTLQAN